MIKYLVVSPGYQSALDIFERHTATACDGVLGYAKTVVPRFVVGTDRWDELKQNVVNAMLEELPNHTSSFQKYVDSALQIEETIATRLAQLPPDQFEGMLHPAFEEDEWMLILLGGVLGIIVGVFQAAVLGG